MTKCIAVVNEKGGVGKTTSVLELAYQAGSRGLKVLVVDLDSQGNATKMLVEDPCALTVFDVLIDTDDRIQIGNVLKPARDSWPNTIVLPADVRLGTIDAHLQSRISKEQILKSVLAPISSLFDLIIFDTAPTMNTLTVNALVAANGYLVPTDLSPYSQQGMRSIHKVASILRKTGNNPSLEFIGCFVTSFQKGGSLAVRAILDELSQEYGERFLCVRIPDAVKVAESQRASQPVGLISAESPVAEAYKSLFNAVYTEATNEL